MWLWVSLAWLMRILPRALDAPRHIGVWLGLVSIPVSGWSLIATAVALGLSPAKRAGPLRPLDRAGTRIVAVPAEVLRCAEDFDTVSHARVRRLVADVEMLAREAEGFGAARVRWWDRGTRREARLRGQRLAAVVRGYKVRLATAVSGDDLLAVAGSLAQQASAWASSDLEAMLRDAPDIELRRSVRRVLLRLAPAAGLLALAIGGPLLPPLNASAQAADSFRSTLIITAVISLVTGATQLPEAVKDVVGKSLPPGGKDDD